MAAFSPRHCLSRSYLSGPATRRRDGGKELLPLGGSAHQYSHLVLPLPGQDFLPCKPVPVLHSPAGMARCGGAPGNAVSGRSLGGRVSVPPQYALPLSRLGLVHYHFAPGHWHHPSRDPGHRRSLHLHSFDRNFHRRLLEFAEAVARITGGPPHDWLGYYGGSDYSGASYSRSDRLLER